MAHEITTWENIRAKVAKVNRPLAEAIDKLNPDKSLSLEIGTFKYGEEIISAYQPRPFLVLEKSCELFFEFGERPKTFAMFRPGEMAFSEELFGNQAQAWSSQDWKITAGARSAFMPAKISDYQYHKKIQKALNIDSEKPDQFHDQWNVFREIAQAPIIKSNWKCQVLFFGQSWGDYQHDPAWQSFYHILNQKYQRSYNAHLSLTTITRAMNRIQHERPIRFTLLQSEEILYLLSLGLGHTPGFKVAQNEEALPLKLLQSTYLEHYKLKDYAPLILTPAYFDWMNPNETPLYASISYSTSHYLPFKTNTALTNVQELESLVWGFKKLHTYLLNNDFLTENSQLHQFLSAYEYIFYHKKDSGDFYSPKLLTEHDNGLMKGWDQEKFQFPIHSTFWQGSVAIKKATP